LHAGRRLKVEVTLAAHENHGAITMPEWNLEIGEAGQGSPNSPHARGRDVDSGIRHLAPLRLDEGEKCRKAASGGWMASENDRGGHVTSPAGSIFSKCRRLSIGPVVVGRDRRT
jgi:hypothetical protein